MTTFLLIAGSQRSGTTLMGQILGAHPESVLIDETDRLYRWSGLMISGAKSNLIDEGFHQCVRKAFSKYRYPNDRFTPEGLLKKHIKYAVLKGPNLTFYFDRLPQTFQKLYVIRMIRDIRDIVASVRQFENVPIITNQLSYFRTVKGLNDLFPDEWRILNDDSLKKKPYILMAVIAKIKMDMANKYADSGVKVISIRYEDLVAKPLEEINRTLAQCNMKFYDTCVQFERAYQGTGPGGMVRSRPLNDYSVGNWKNVLNDMEEKDIWDVVGSFMQNHGYTR